MNELAFASSVLFIFPVVYIVHNVIRLNKGINQYTQQVVSFNAQSVSPSNALTTTLKPNLTLVRCQKCNSPEQQTEEVSIVAHQ